MTDINQASFAEFFTLNAKTTSSAQQEMLQLSLSNNIGPDHLEQEYLRKEEFCLVNMLSKRQRHVPFTTSQDLHLQPNLDLLVGGED